MGRSETATACIGYCVRVKDLLESIKDMETCCYAYKVLTDYDVFVEDENEEINHLFRSRAEQLVMKNESWEANKDTWMTQLNPLREEALLIPVHLLATTTRWGYSREGENGTEATVEDDFPQLLADLKAQRPLCHEVVWIIHQSGG